MKLLFCNYGEFGNNSSHHIDGFAREMVHRGHTVGVIALGLPICPHPGIAVSTYRSLEDGTADAAILGLLRDSSTLLHAWTPRERIRRWVEPLGRRGVRYVVHLEDDEQLVTASQLHRSVPALASLDDRALDRIIPDHLTHPSRLQPFLAKASGVTVIVDRLRKLVPQGRPTLVLEPGIDTSLFAPRLNSGERAARRANLGVAPTTTVLMYHGSVHPAVQRDVFSLYTAVAKLRRAGLDVKLLRCGTQDVTTETSTAYRRSEGIVWCGFIPRDEMPAMLELADIFVQPGWFNPFNAHRLPSKLLEFFAMERPVLLSKVFAGLGCVDGYDAVVLREGGADEIVRCVMRLMLEPTRAREIAVNGRRFVESNFRWSETSHRLEKFYGGLT